MEADTPVVAPALRLDRVRSRVTWDSLRRLFRYGMTSAIALGVSEVTLLVILATHLTGATVAATIASLVGVLPSYLISRYWIWPEAERRRTGRQVALYWSISAVSIAITSLGTGFLSHHTPERGAEHLAIVGIGFPAINLVLWAAKYIAYQRVVFRTGDGVAGDETVLAAEAIDPAAEPHAELAHHQHAPAQPSGPVSVHGGEPLPFELPGRVSRSLAD